MGAVYSCCFRSIKDGETAGTTQTTISPPSVVIKQPGQTEKLPIKIEEVVPEFPLQLSSKLPQAQASIGNASSIMNLYNKYVNREMGQISAEGIERLCEDLELNPEDFRVLVLAYSLGAQVMCSFTEEEFVNGCEKHGMTSIETMKEAIPRLMESVKGKSFTPFYQWTYKFALDIESGQRTLPTEMAVSLWRLVFTQNCPNILDKWLHYIETEVSARGISKDTWDMFLIFVDQIGDDLQSYDDAEAWPSLLDDFVEFELAKSEQTLD